MHIPSPALLLSLTAFAGLAAAPPPVPAKRGTAMAIVGFVPKEVLGYVRPIVVAHINGHAMPMMVHSNAGFTMQLKHAQAARFGVRDMKAIGGKFGIERAGQVSTLGPARGRVATLAIGAAVDHDVPVSVFEVPQDDYGMLGIGWMRRNRVIVDYAGQTITVTPTRSHAAALAARLRATGYRAVPMTFDDALGIFTVPVSIGGAVGRMTVATASGTDIDPTFAHRAGIGIGAQFAVGRGPTGTSVPRHRPSGPIVIAIEGWSSRPSSDAEIVEDYAYGGQPRPGAGTATIDGTLGSPFLIAARAVVDFGNRVLYLR